MCIWLHRIGLSLSLANNQGHTALHKAAYKGHGELCRWLVGNTRLGPQPETSTGSLTGYTNQCDDNPAATDGATGIRAEVEEEELWCLGFIADAGGYTPSMIAREQRHSDLAEWLSAMEVAHAPVGHREERCPDSGEEKRKLVLTGPLGKLDHPPAEPVATTQA